MKRIKRNFALALLAGAALSFGIFAGCDNGSSGDDENGGGNAQTEDIFQSYSPGSISVDNMTNQRLIAFKGAVSASTLISGIPADCRGHMLKLDTKLFNKTGDFALYLLTEDQYNENKNDLTAVRNSPFAIIYAYYDKSAESTLSFPISQYSGGNGKLTLNNNSAFNCEIRINSPRGDILGYVGSYEVNKTVNMEPGDYTLFPAFKKFVSNANNGTGEIYTFEPKYVTTGGPLSVDFAIDGTAQAWDVGNLYDPSRIALSTGGFYLTVNNQSRTAVQFKNGNTEYETSVGIRGIKSGASTTFFVAFTKLSDGTYPEKLEMQQLNIGGSGFPFYIPTQEFKLDTRYTVTVSGAEKDNLTLSTITEDGVVDINGILGL